MLFHIKHTTRYIYSKMVFCEPFTVRLRPREDASQRLVRFQLSIDPEPAGRCDIVEVDGSAATQCWFNVPTCSLMLQVNTVVETLRSNPFDFLLDSAAVKLPISYRDEFRPALSPYFAPAQTAGAVLELAQRIAGQSDRSTIGFLIALSNWTSENIEKIIRHDGDPLPAEVTLLQGRGTCRDLAVLFNEACRSVGLAARFVSGYQAQPEDDGQRHLHAWSEVYLPGAGWRGFDPGQGLAVADQHVALAAGAHPLAAAPTQGTFRGTGVASTLESQVVIRLS